MREQLQPCCKWCKRELEQTQSGTYLATFCPISRWESVQLSQEEKRAVEEAENLSEAWREAMRKHGYYICPSEYFGRQSERSYFLAEGAFEKLLYSGGMICPGCYSKFADASNIYEDHTDLDTLH